MRGRKPGKAPPAPAGFDRLGPPPAMAAPHSKIKGKKFGPGKPRRGVQRKR